MTPDQTSAAATAAAVYVALYSAHQFGDHWIQRSTEAMGKGAPGLSGRWMCGRHVATLTATKLGAVALAWFTLGLSIGVVGLVVGLAVDAASHYWADRRTTLRRLAHAAGKGGWWDNDPQAPYLLDQSWHVAWLLPTALIIATV
ncbi:transcriptional regulator [Embleya sp. NPDC005575]|uniref:transcriptional regulator n=1 Tax=Embleya sp. NPDC005575 TaxID=3156892 RepID=UPI0033BEEFA9